MKKETKAKLQDAMDYCDDNDKSTEFMIQYMQDYACVDFDCVIKFLSEKQGKENKNGKIKYICI